MRRIPPSLKEKLSKQEYTKYQNSEPQIEVTIARARSSIQDTNYFNIETIREKVGISEVAVAIQRLLPHGSPTGIYDIHIDNGIAKTSKREYPDKYAEGFINQFEIGPAKSVAIAFDGRWELNRINQWSIRTFLKPYIFWVEEDGNLFTQLWDEEETRKELAVNVSKVKAIRGWKSVGIPTHDHGVIAAYIKEDGKVYYKNYSEQEDGNYRWENERVVEEFTGIAQNINLFITNDYRVGFMIENVLGITSWVITSRNWAGMAISPERIYVRQGAKLDFINTVKQDLMSIHGSITLNIKELNIAFLYSKTDNKFTYIENTPDEEGDWGKILILRTQNELYNYSTIDFEIQDKFSRLYYPESIERLGYKEYKLTFANFNDVDKEGTLKFLGMETKNGVGEVYTPFEQIFYPQNLEPVGLPLPEVEAIWNE
ncbi:hypothetical protein SYNTR_0903 [Candidatus Syntrophocurvum alkaliphilum]|uniref:Uncharacterized protein n=1 Tax=Candidatus Syntrophocurvum alkaliphilum TaxID=2293317 RepID=A0A6I6DE33_9FIRM|nr:hypothetical protein [Candidatus Syntrophocurvum alkaliphilum]QGT99496.1 hypothetical protein SYNTR_0903 [Candidatus Syntrophocurvum alkaliphilum]